ncbi:MAG TPA: hypothetical protein DF614_04370 [Methylococcaceae bacterium]|nr:hypothetical protein [Methylococcaceae bacterium]
MLYFMHILCHIEDKGRYVDVISVAQGLCRQKTAIANNIKKKRSISSQKNDKNSLALPRWINFA